MKLNVQFCGIVFFAIFVFTQCSTSKVCLKENVNVFNKGLIVVFYENWGKSQKTLYNYKDSRDISDEVFYLLRFYTIDSVLYLNSYLYYTFPEMSIHSDSIFFYDQTKMNYYRILNSNVIIMTDTDNEIYKFQTNRNKCIDFVKEKYKYNSFRNSLLLGTYCFEDGLIIESKRRIFSPKYSSEKYLRIIDDTIKIN